MISRDPQLQRDLDAILNACAGVGTLLDELTLIRVSLRLYMEGHQPAAAVALASEMLSNSLTKHHSR